MNSAKQIAAIACAIVLGLVCLPPQAPAQSLERLMPARVSAMQRQLRSVGDIMDSRARAIQHVQKFLNAEDRKLAAWREVEDFEARIEAQFEEFARMLETAIAADKSAPARIDAQILTSRLQTDRGLEQTLLSLIRLSNQQATALALLPRTRPFWMLQRPIDETALIAEDWHRQWNNTIADEEELRARIATP